MIIKNIEAIPLNMQYDPELAPHLIRSGLTAFNNRMTLYRVELEGGAVGYGDQMGGPDDVSAFIGRQAIAGLVEIRHPGVQMACYDAVGRALDLPVHALMGRQVRSRVPFAYWTPEIPAEMWADQTRKAVGLGYRVYKTKCRPWFDPIEQVEQAAAVAPGGFRFWLDFNGHLRNVRQALPVLQALSRYDIVAGFESPIPQRDAEGYRSLRARIDRPIAAHYGSGCCHVRSDRSYDPGVPARTQIVKGLCDGFVLGAPDVFTIRQQDAVAAEARLPFWVQTIGSGLRAAWVAHLVSTCRQAELSSLAAHTIWETDITRLPEPVAGWLPVPEGPGLGVEVDEEAVEMLRRAPVPEVKRRIATVVYPDGTEWHFGDETQRHEAYHFGSAPGFVRGVRLTTREDDGSADFAELFECCSKEPVLSG